MKVKWLHRLSSMKGFTMIELLVVIAIIGVLAVAVLSAINPIEQINKGRDTRNRSDAGELLSAIERYFSTSEQYPWNSSTNASAPYDQWIAIADVSLEFNSDGAMAWLQVLQNSNEVKPAFAQRIYNTYQTKTGLGTPTTGNMFIVAKDANSDMVRVCFKPQSQQFKNEAVYKCCSPTSTGGMCGDAAATNLKGSTPQTVGGWTMCANNNGDVSNSNSVFYICLP